jgi:hypothetical protein
VVSWSGSPGIPSPCTGGCQRFLEAYSWQVGCLGLQPHRADTWQQYEAGTYKLAQAVDVVWSPGVKPESRPL